MRLPFILAVLCSVLAGCKTASPSLEVAPAEHWAGTDGNGPYEHHYRYKPFIVRQGKPFTLDLSRPNSFQSPDTGRRERYFDGVRARMTVTLSNGLAYVEGRCDYKIHLGVVRSYYQDDGALYAQALSDCSTRFTGMTQLGHELRIPANDEDDELSVCVTFRDQGEPIEVYKGNDGR